MYVEDKNKGTSGALDIVFQDRSMKKTLVASKEQADRKRGYKELVLDLFERTPEVGRLLVRLHDRNKLYSMAHSPDDLARADITQTIVDLLSFDLTTAEAELISDVLVGLVNQAERDLRKALAERLAVMEGVPLRLVLKMADDEIFVADPILKKSADLKDFDLIYILKSKGKEHWQSMATRPQMPSKIVDMLADTEDLETACNLVENKSISLSEYAVSKFVGMAKESDRLAKPLLMREELSETMASELYNFVGEALKSFINENFNVEGILDSAVDDVVAEFILDVNAELPASSMAHFEVAMEKGLLKPSVMLEHLKRGQVSSFIAQFSVYCGLPIDAVKEMVSQDVGQSLAIACKASNITKADFTNMYLLTSRVRGSRVVEESKLSRALKYYDKVSEDMARDLLRQYRH